MSSANTAGSSLHGPRSAKARSRRLHQSAMVKGSLVQNYSGVLFSPGGSHGEAECGPSPATPYEIRRLVIEAAQRHEVDVDFALAIATAESRLDRLRNSPKGARGPMQLMPETADRFGVADICDPEQNVDGGVRYLRELIDEFRHPTLVAAAYNAGEGRVREYGGIPPFKETVGYVAEVLNLQMELATGPVAPDKGASVNGRGPASSVSGVDHFNAAPAMGRRGHAFLAGGRHELPF